MRHHSDLLGQMSIGICSPFSGEETCGREIWVLSRSKLNTETLDDHLETGDIASEFEKLGASGVLPEREHALRARRTAAMGLLSFSGVGHYSLVRRMFFSPFESCRRNTHIRVFTDDQL